MAWVPLHVHSQYSVLRATPSIEKLVRRSKDLGCSSLALTDQGNMFGAVEFYKECRSQGIKPILGCELHVAPFSCHDKKRIPGYASGYPIILLVKNNQGYKNLCKLTSFAHLEGFYYTPRVDKELLKSFSEGLVCLSGPIQGRVGSLILEEKSEELLEEIAWFQSVFKEDFYFEVQRHRMSPEVLAHSSLVQEGWLHQKYEEFIRDQEIVIDRVKNLSQQTGIPCVATPDIQYLYPDDWKAHEILINIQSGEPCEVWDMDSAGNRKALVLNPKREVLYSQKFYFPTEEEMREAFSDMPEAVDNTSEIANACVFDFDFKTKYYPVFVPPHMEGTVYDPAQREKEAEKFLRDLCESSVSTRYPEEVLESIRLKYPDKDPREMVRSRLDYELDIITSKGMVDYLLIVYDFIAWAKNNLIPMGPGRGSGAGSIILYLIGITDIEPLRFSLFFERFINPERISYPDIDVDICMERRQEVIDYTVQKYGKDRVAQIITFGTMKAKMALKDVGRVLSIPLAKVNALAKLIPEDPNMTLEKALEIDPDLKSQYDSDPEVHKLITIALKLEGSVRNTGIHAAGLIIGGQALMENIPLCSPKDSEMAVTQFSMKPVESVGLLKIDFLGLKTLSSIQRAVNAVKNQRGIIIPWVNLPLDDQATFNLLNQGKTQGVFQLESGGMQELAKHLHIDKFEEIIAVGALYRPGPMEMIPSFIQRKHGKEAIEMDHPFMTDILSETYGIMVYQEQVMQIASRLANYSLGEGDVLRRAMGKKDREEMAKQREKFKQGALQNGIEETISMQIFDKIEKFASYGFNKSHAAAYGYLSYVTAYLKANYPMEWMAALMTSDRDDTAKVAKLIRESRASGILVLPPDINESALEFVATSQGIRFAMGGIKGVGEGVVDAILAERSKGGPFTSLYNFIKRIEIKKVGKKVIESLIEAGCFDGTGWSRAALIDSVDPMFSDVARQQKERAQGFLDFFSILEETGGVHSFEIQPTVCRMIPKQHTLQREYELLGFYLREHPLDDFRSLFPKLSCRPLHEMGSLDKMAVCRTAFIIETVSVKISGKTQKKFAILVVSDGLETVEVSVWPEVYEQVNSLLIENQLIYAVLLVEQQEEGIKFQARWLGDLTKADEEMIKVCDDMYEKGLSYLKIAQLKEKRSVLGKEKKIMVKEEGKEKSEGKKVLENLFVELSVDLGKARLSHMLSIKKIFRAHPGDTPVLVHFFSEEHRVSSVRIESEWGVAWDEPWEEKLKEIPSIFAVKK